MGRRQGGERRVGDGNGVRREGGGQEDSQKNTLEKQSQQGVQEAAAEGAMWAVEGHSTVRVIYTVPRRSLAGSVFGKCPIHHCHLALGSAPVPKTRATRARVPVHHGSYNLGPRQHKLSHSRVILTKPVPTTAPESLVGGNGTCGMRKRMQSHNLTKCLLLSVTTTLSHIFYNITKCSQHQ